MSFTLKSQIPQIVAQLPERARQVVERTLFAWETESKLLAPVDTGFLRRSIQTAMESNFSGVIFVGADYGVHVNYGTRRKAANPFFDGGRDAAEKVFQAEMSGLKELFA